MADNDTGSDEPALPPVLTVGHLTKRWHVSDQFVYDEIKAGRLIAMRYGPKLLRIKREAVEAYECQSTLGASENSPEPEKMEPNIGPIVSSGKVPANDVVSHSARLTRLQRTR